MAEVIFTSWVNKYRVNRYQKSTIVLLNDELMHNSEALMLKELRLVQNMKRTSSGFPRSIFGYLTAMIH